MRKNNQCPICGKFEFTQEYMDKNGISVHDMFDCPVCGGQISYLVLCKHDEITGSEEYIAIYDGVDRKIGASARNT